MDVLIEMLIRAVEALFSDRKPAKRKPVQQPRQQEQPPQSSQWQQFHQPPGVHADPRRREAAVFGAVQKPPAMRRMAQTQAMLKGRVPMKKPMGRPSGPPVLPRQRLGAPAAPAAPAARGQRIAASPPPPPQSNATAAGGSAGAATAGRSGTAARPAAATVNGAAIRQWAKSRPGALSTMWILSEILQPPLALRESDHIRG